MTKYQELKEALRAEEERLAKEFKTKAKSGDFVRRGDEYGVLFERDGMLVIIPIQTNLSMQEFVDARNVTDVELLKDFSEVAKRIQEDAAALEKAYKDMPR